MGYEWFRVQSAVAYHFEDTFYASPAAFGQRGMKGFACHTSASMELGEAQITRSTKVVHVRYCSYTVAYHIEGLSKHFIFTSCYDNRICPTLFCLFKNLLYNITILIGDYISCTIIASQFYTFRSCSDCNNSGCS